MPPGLRPSLGLATGLALALATSIPDASAVAAMSAGPPELAALLARYDREPAGPAKDKLAAEVDAAAHQKYATISRLYWHTDFSAARMAARERKQPILHLRMLGNLAEDLSCANSRFFRATLYANREVSQLLRDNFVLYWSSERAVPRVTIDFGDGRKIERTTTGNSAHYIVDDTGAVLDVLPGLYAPVAFRTELAQSLALAASVRGKSDADRAKLVADYHRALEQRAHDTSKQLGGLPWIPNANQLLSDNRVQTELAAAQLATVSKAAVELSDLRYIAEGMAPDALPDGAVERWASAGQWIYGIGDLKRGADTNADAMTRARGSDATAAVIVRALPGAADANPRPMRRTLREQRAAAVAAPPRVLDDPSLMLVGRLHDALPAELRGTAEQRVAAIARLEQHIVADTALNQVRLRPQISREIVRLAGRADFAALNAWVYAKVFRTPQTDAWLGLLPRTDFTGLPGDGVVMP